MEIRGNIIKLIKSINREDWTFVRGPMRDNWAMGIDHFRYSKSENNYPRICCYHITMDDKSRGSISLLNDEQMIFSQIVEEWKQKDKSKVLGSELERLEAFIQKL